MLSISTTSNTFELCTVGRLPLVELDRTAPQPRNLLNLGLAGLKNSGLSFGESYRCLPALSVLAALQAPVPQFRVAKGDEVGTKVAER